MKFKVIEVATGNILAETLTKQIAGMVLLGMQNASPGTFGHYKILPV